MNGEADTRKVLCDIAHCAFDVINRILDLDQNFAPKLRFPENSSHQFFREECITADMAATLKKNFPKNVEIILFTPHEENKFGADWYWRFERGKYAIHALVQAKRVQWTKYNQKDEKGNIDINLKQLQDLINITNDEESGLPGLESWLATFARLEATPPCNNKSLNNCKFHKHPSYCSVHRPSLWIAKVEELFKSYDEKVPEKELVSNIVAKSIRLDCLLPCIDTKNTDTRNGPSIKGFYLRENLPSYEECVSILQENSLHTKLEGGLRIYI